MRRLIANMFASSKAQLQPGAQSRRETDGPEVLPFIEVSFHGQRFVRCAPVVFFGQNRLSGKAYLDNAAIIQPGEIYQVLSAAPEDLGVGAGMRPVRRCSDGADGHVTELALAGDMSAAGHELWAAEDPQTLRRLVEVRLGDGVLYAPNLLLERKLAEAETMLAGIASRAWQKGDANQPHPLQVGSEAHRLGLFALSGSCIAERRSQITALLQRLAENWFAPMAEPVGKHGSLSWPYSFDFPLPWHAQLKAPWHSGYAAAAITGALACTHALTGDARWLGLMQGSLAYMRMPLAEGGPAYQINGLPHVAEYVGSPHFPNYRTFDGEVMCIPYLYNTAVLTGDDALLAKVLRLIEGIKDVLPVMSPEGQAPRFGMDGQPINPGYMLQMWFVAQILANIAKDQSFTALARRWATHVASEHRTEGFPR
jgi:hypothetical protein